MMSHVLVSVMVMIFFSNNLCAMSAAPAAPAGTGAQEVSTGVAPGANPADPVVGIKADVKVSEKDATPEEKIYTRFADNDGCPYRVPKTALVREIFARYKAAVRSPGNNSKSFFNLGPDVADKEDTLEFWDNLLLAKFVALCLNENNNFIGFGLITEVCDDAKKVTQVNIQALIVDEEYADRNLEVPMLAFIYEMYPAQLIQISVPEGYDHAALIKAAGKLIAKNEDIAS